MIAQSIFDFERLARAQLHAIAQQYLTSLKNSTARLTSELTLNSPPEPEAMTSTTEKIESVIADFLMNLQHDLLLHKYPEWSVETEPVAESFRSTCQGQITTEEPLLFSFAYMASLLSNNLLGQETLESLHRCNTSNVHSECEITSKQEDPIASNAIEYNRVVQVECRQLLSFPDTLLALAVAAFTQCVRLDHEHERTNPSILERNSLLVGKASTTTINNNIATSNDRENDDTGNYSKEEILQSLINGALRRFYFDKDLYLSRVADAFWVFALSQGIDCTAYANEGMQQELQEEFSGTMSAEQNDRELNVSRVLHFTERSAKYVVHSFVNCAMQRGVWQRVLERLKHVPFDKLQHTLRREWKENRIAEETNNSSIISNDNTTWKVVKSLFNVLDAVIVCCSKRKQGMKSRFMYLEKMSKHNVINNKIDNITKESTEKSVIINEMKNVEEIDRQLHISRWNVNVNVVCSSVHWQHTILTLFDVCNTHKEVRNEMFRFIRLMLKRANTGKDSIAISGSVLVDCLFHSICIDMTCRTETPRPLLKIIFTELITPLFVANSSDTHSTTSITSSSYDELYTEKKENILVDENNEDINKKKLECNEEIDTMQEQQDDVKSKVTSPVKSSDIIQRINDAFERIFREWSNKDIVLNGSLKLNATIMNSVMYSMQVMQQELHYQQLPTRLLSSLLDGVHVRLECVRALELRDAALIVSAAFATMFVEHDEITTGLMANDQFAQALQGWLYEEQFLTSHDSNTQNNNNNNNNYNNSNNSSKKSDYFIENQTSRKWNMRKNNLLSNSSMASHEITNRRHNPRTQRICFNLILRNNITLSQNSSDNFMLDPDETYMFYTNSHQTREHEQEGRHQEMHQTGELLSQEKDYTSVSRTDELKNKHFSWEQIDAHRNVHIQSCLAQEMPSFGIQEHPMELNHNTNINISLVERKYNNAVEHVSKSKWLQMPSTPTLTLRGCYNVLMGIGRKPQAQQHEIEEDNELGLTQLYNLLQLHCLEYCRFNQMSQNGQTDNGCKLNGDYTHKSIDVHVAELNNMTGMLIPFLVSVELHAPADVLYRLHHLRFMCIVYIIMLCPRMTLFALSNMMYGVNYGVAQRVEMIEAVGYAAYGLAHGLAFCSPSSNRSNYHAHSNKDASANNGSQEEEEEEEEEEEFLHKHNASLQSPYKYTTPSRLIYPPIPSTTPTSQSSSSFSKPSSLSTLLPLSSRTERKKIAIAVSEGKQTRRWGYAVHPRSTDPRRRTSASSHREWNTFEESITHNMLSNYAENFITVFLSKIEVAADAQKHVSHNAKHFDKNNNELNSARNVEEEEEEEEEESSFFLLERNKKKEKEEVHHGEQIEIEKEDSHATHNSQKEINNESRWDYTTYHFWQTSDPYTPSSILRVIALVVQSLSHVRHVISSLCARHVHFITAVAHSHPHSTVRQLGWITLGEVMRAWCNAPPLFVATVENWNSSSKINSSIAQDEIHNASMSTRQANLHQSSLPQRDTCASSINNHAVRLVHSSLLSSHGTAATQPSRSLMLSASWLAAYDVIGTLVKSTLQQSENAESAETVNVMLLIMSSLQELIESAHDNESYNYINAPGSASIQVIH